MKYSIVVFENVTIYVALILLLRLLRLLRCYNRGRRMKNVRENEVEAYLRRQVEKLGGLCIKIPADYSHSSFLLVSVCPTVRGRIDSFLRRSPLALFSSV